MILLRIACGDCGRRMGTISDAPQGKVLVSWTNRRPTDWDFEEYELFDSTIPQPDPKTLSAKSVRHLTFHCYRHADEEHGLLSTLRLKDLEPQIDEARRIAKTLTLRCAMTNVWPDT